MKEAFTIYKASSSQAGRQEQAVLLLQAHARLGLHQLRIRREGARRAEIGGVELAVADAEEPARHTAAEAVELRVSMEADEELVHPNQHAAEHLAYLPDRHLSSPVQLAIGQHWDTAAPLDHVRPRRQPQHQLQQHPLHLPRNQPQQPPRQLQQQLQQLQQQLQQFGVSITDTTAATPPPPRAFERDPVRLLSRLTSAAIKAAVLAAVLAVILVGAIPEAAGGLS